MKKPYYKIMLAKLKKEIAVFLLFFLIPILSFSQGVYDQQEHNDAMKVLERSFLDGDLIILEIFLFICFIIFMSYYYNTSPFVSIATKKKYSNEFRNQRKHTSPDEGFEYLSKGLIDGHPPLVNVIRSEKKAKDADLEMEIQNFGADIYEKKVFFKKILASKKAVVFTVTPATADQVAQSTEQQSVNFTLGGANVTGRKAFHNFGLQYLAQVDCTKITKAQEPKVGQEFFVLTDDEPVISKKTGKPIANLLWANLPDDRLNEIS